MTPDLARLLRAHLLEWSATYGLGDERSRRVAEAYVHFCSPASANACGVELDAEYMSWYFAYNDLEPGTEAVSAIREARRLLLDSEPPPSASQTTRYRAASPHAAATAGLRQLMSRRLPRDGTSRLDMHFAHLFESFVREPDLAISPACTDSYLRNRVHTVGAYPHFEIWRLALGLIIPEQLAPLIHEAETQSATVIHISNDIMSIRRDKRKRKPNLVFHLMHEHSTSEILAIAMALDLLRAQLAEFKKTRHTISAVASTNFPVNKYVHFLAAAIEGNRQATLTLGKRYAGEE